MNRNRTTDGATARSIFARLRDPRLLVVGVLAFALAVGIAHRAGPIGEMSGWQYTAGKFARPDKVPNGMVKPVSVTLVPGSATKLFHDFRRIGYRLEDVRRGLELVPRVFVKSMPRDIRRIQSVKIRKAFFIKTMLPLVLSVNEELRNDRVRAMALFDALDDGETLGAEDQAWLDARYQRYGVKLDNRDLLLRRMDVIPPSLALAQAAEESGWGTSRFAIEGRALFGQRTYSDKSAGIVPAKAESGNFKVRAFNQLLDAVRSYALNLNTHGAYREFREKRELLRATADGVADLDSMELAEALSNYSERGQDYIDTIKTIIRVNDLRALDGARLSETDKRALELIGA